MVLSNNSQIDNKTINNLVIELEELRIASERSVQEIQRILRENRRREARLEQRIERTQTALKRGNNHNRGNNLFVNRDMVRITNSLRNERGITGIVVNSGARMVTLKNVKTSRLYMRAHWNIEYTSTNVHGNTVQ